MSAARVPATARRAPLPRMQVGQVPHEAFGYLRAAAKVLYPVFSVTIPPLVDSPNHLARIHILKNFDTDPALQANDAIEWAVRPNLGIDLVLPSLSGAIGTYAAGRVFIAATLLLRRVLVGSVGFLPVAAFLLLCNHVFYWGC